MLMVRDRLEISHAFKNIKNQTYLGDCYPYSAKWYMQLYIL